MLPAKLIVQRDQRFGVMVIDDNRARFLPLEDAREGRAAIASLPADRMIITDPLAGIADGDEVKPQ